MISSAAHLLSFLAVLLLIPRTTIQRENLIGQQVMIVEWDTEVRMGAKIVRRLDLGKVLVVTKVSGGELWFNETVGGWVKRSHVARYQYAINLFNRAIKRDPSGANYYNRAHAWVGMGNLDAALSDVNEALQRGMYENSYNLRGEICRQKGEYDRAIVDFDKVLLLNRENVGAYNNRGLVWIEKEDYARAISDFSEAIRLDPGSVMAYNNRGCTWKMQGEYDRAIADYFKVIRLDPRCVSAYYNRGSAHEERGDYDRAMADYEQAIRLESRHYRAHGNLAWLLATCPEHEYRNGKRAVEHATKTCELLNWRHDKALAILSAAFAAVGNYCEAEELLAKAIELNPDSDNDTREKMFAAYWAGLPYIEEPEQE